LNCVDFIQLAFYSTKEKTKFLKGRREGEKRKNAHFVPLAHSLLSTSDFFQLSYSKYLAISLLKYCKFYLDFGL